MIAAMPTENNDPGPGTGASARRHGTWLLPLIIMSGLLLAYGPVLDGPLFFDDEPNLLDNKLVQLDGGSFDAWRIAVVSNDSGPLLRPVAMLSFALNYIVAGEFTPFGLKAVNLLLHLACGVLLYLLTLAVLRAPAVSAAAWTPEQRRLVALGAAALWLLHPLHVSTVLYAVQRMAQLSALFTLAGLLLFLQYRLRWAQRGAGAGEVLAGALWLLVLVVLAVLSKENGALLPWLVLVLEVTLFQGIWAGRRLPVLASLAWLALVLPALLIGLAVAFAPEILPVNYGSREFNLEERLLSQARALWLYLGWLAVPDITQMGFFHDDIPLSRTFWSPLTTGVSVLAWCLAAVFSLTAFRKFPLLAFAFLFYLVGHSMESSVLPLELYFEHRNYLPSVGFAVLLATGVMRLGGRAEVLRYTPAMCGISLLLATLLVLRSQAWGDVGSLARHNVVNHPDSPRANFYYALTLMEEFQEVKKAGADPEREGALAVASRSHYMRMHELDPRDIAGVVTLYQFDTMHFPAAAERHDWLAVLERLAGERPLQSADLSALGSLVTFVENTPDAQLQERVLAIILQWHDRYPYRAVLAGYAWRLHLATGGDRAAMLPVLEKTLASSSRSTQAAGHLVGYHARGDLPAAYDALLEWIRRDTLRRELPVIKELLTQ